MIAFVLRAACIDRIELPPHLDINPAIFALCIWQTSKNVSLTEYLDRVRSKFPPQSDSQLEWSSPAFPDQHRLDLTSRILI